jgi:hypothetical protein
LLRYAQRQKTNVQQQENTATNNWPSYIMPAEDVFPGASIPELQNLVAGIDINNRDISFTTPQLLVLIFPYLYPNGTGHYSLGTPPLNIHDNAGGYPKANNLGTLKKYEYKVVTIICG